MLATAALFMTTPYVGYLDNTLMIFLLCLTFPFIPAARTSWPARVALFFIGIAAAFTHPTTCVHLRAVLDGPLRLARGDAADSGSGTRCAPTRRCCGRSGAA